MAWVRIHDGALTHPRIVGIVDWKSPFCVWVWGLSYCQQHLTDGIIPVEAVPNEKALKTAAVLLDRGLWVRHNDAFKVRDYLQHNDSRDVVLAKRAGGRQRLMKHRASHTDAPVKRVTEVDQQNAHPPSGVVLREGVSSSSEGVQGEPAAEHRRVPDRRVAPRREGEFGRIYLHRWQLDSLIDLLGPHADDFALDEWLDALNHRIAHQALPPDPWKFVKSELHAEIRRRGLPVVDVPEARMGKQTTRLASALESIQAKEAAR